MAKNLANTIKPAYTHWKPLSDEEFELSMNDFVSFCENSIVLDKNGAPVKFTLNEAQELFASHFLEAIKPILAKTPTPSVKVCCHKSRQMGITTVCLKLEQYVMSKATNMNAIHIMPTEDEANEMIDRKLTPLLQATHPELMATMVAADKHVDFKDLEGVMLDNRLTFMSSGTQGAGHGRCHPKDDTIPTPEGLRLFGDLKKGDTVYARDGSPTKVLDVYERGEQQLYMVTLANGKKIEVGADHRWLIRKGDSGTSTSVVETTELMQRLDSGRLSMVPSSGAVRGVEQDLPVDPYILGLLIGDGWMGSRVNLSTKDEYFLQFGSSFYTDKRNGVHAVHMSNRLRGPLSSLGLLDKHSHDKFIPEVYLIGSIEQRKSLLAGLLDTDGSYSRTARQVEFSTISGELALGVQRLAWSLGGKATVVRRKTPGFRGKGFTGSTSHRVLMRFDFNPFRFPKKADAWQKPVKREWSSVKSIVPTRVADSVCIAVDNDEHTYIGGRDWVVTHNTIHMAIFDEYAKYIDPFSLEAGVLPAMSGNTIRVVLFTAKGMNHAYDLAEVAKDEESDWIYMFLPWYIMSEYEMEPEGRYKTLEGLTDYDVFLFEEFKRAGVPPSKWARKAMWYNYTFINEAKRDTKYMYENYPTIAEESFRASGSPIFDAHKLAEWSSREFKRLDMFSDGDGTEFRYTEEGILREYEPPKRGASYILGADPADGDVAGDDSALVVWRVADEKITAVASYNGTVTQTDFAELVFDVATRYNDALVVPERNVGQLMIKWLVDIKGYANIWTDAKKVSGYNNLGVYTTQAVKNEMISRLKFLINNGYYEDFDPVFCEQAKYFTYQKTPSGQMKAAAAAGKHDDMVLSRLLAVMSLDMDQFGDYNHQIVREGKKYG